MRDYLLDTSVASILDPHRGMLTAEFEAWLIARDHRLHVSAITIFETMQGTRRLAHAARARALEAWLGGLIADFGERILSVDVEIAKVAGELSAAAYAIGRHPGAADILIAATAKTHNLMLLTRNLKHFEPLGIPAVDPTAGLPR